MSAENGSIISLERLSFAACFPVYVEDTSTARARVIGIFEQVDEERNQATSQQQSETKRQSLNWFKSDKL